MPRSNDLLARIRPEKPRPLLPYEIQVVTRHHETSPVFGQPDKRYNTGKTVYCLFAYGPQDAAMMWRHIWSDSRLCDCKWTCHQFRVRRWRAADSSFDTEALGLGRALTSLGRL